MSISETKLELISWLCELEDLETLNQITLFKKQYEKSLTSMSTDKLRDSLAEAEEDYIKGKIISQEELEKRIKAGRVL